MSAAAALTLSGQFCTSTTTQAPTVQYSCDSGWTLSGSSCSRSSTSTVAASISGHSCSPGYTLQPDNSCKASTSTPATPKYGCPDGSASTAGGSCPGGVQSTAYIYLGGKAIAEVNSVSGTQYVHTDALGSPVAHTGPGGNLLNTTRYEPYGYVAAGTKPGPATSLMGFTGHVQDPETELVYMQQRYYDPIAGRFLSVDPVVTDANTGKGFGLYTYVENNPYSKIDPDGRYSCKGSTEECEQVDKFVEKIKESRNAEGLKPSERREIDKVVSYLGEKDEDGPIITIAPLSNKTLARTDQNGNITFDVTKNFKSSDPELHGATAMAHEVKHDLDAKKDGPVGKASGREAVLNRERSAYKLESIVGKGLGLWFDPDALESAAQSSTNNLFSR